MPRVKNIKSLSSAAKLPSLLISTRVSSWVRSISLKRYYDSKTIPDVLEQYERLNGKEAKEVYVDRGYKGIKQYKSSTIHVPTPNKNITRQQRKKHSKRAAIEPIIGHLKQDYRLCRNYLKGILGDNMNIILAAAAMNFKRRINLWRTEAIRCWLLIYNMSINAYWILIPQKVGKAYWDYVSRIFSVGIVARFL